MLPNKQGLLMRLWIKGFIGFSLCSLASCTVSLPQQSQVKNIKPVPNIEHSIKKNLQKKRFFPKENGLLDNGGWLIIRLI